MLKCDAVGHAIVAPRARVVDVTGDRRLFRQFTDVVHDVAEALTSTPLTEWIYLMSLASHWATPMYTGVLRRCLPAYPTRGNAEPYAAAPRRAVTASAAASSAVVTWSRNCVPIGDGARCGLKPLGKLMNAHVHIANDRLHPTPGHRGRKGRRRCATDSCRDHQPAHGEITSKPLRVLACSI
jgi:hypothetical protein